MVVILLSIATFLSTMLGGVFALRNRSRLHLIMGFTAGVIIGLVIFDLLPEIFELVHAQDREPTGAMLAVAGGFLLFHIAEKSILIHQGHEHSYAAHRHPRVGVLSALALSGHSFLDGVGIGLGFKVSTAIGVAVAIAVIGHDFADGLNTVTMMLVNNNSRGRAVVLLLVDALAPLLGAASTLLFTLPDSALPLYLGFFAGFLLYIGASDILPDAHSERSRSLTVVLTILGTAFAFGVSRFATG